MVLSSRTENRVHTQAVAKERTPCLPRLGLYPCKIQTAFLSLSFLLAAGKCGFSIVLRRGRNPSMPPYLSRSPRVPVQIYNRSKHISLSSLSGLQRRPDIGKSLQQALNDV